MKPENGIEDRRATRVALEAAGKPLPSLPTGHKSQPTQPRRARSEKSKRRSEIVTQFGDGLPYDRQRVVEQVRFFNRASSEALIELGLLLIKIKERELAGQFKLIVQNELKLSASHARQLMLAALNHLSSPTSRGGRT